MPFVRQLREIQVPTSQSELLALHEIYYQDPGLQDVFQDTVPWFPHMEQEVPVRFLHACGVGTAATEDVLMKRLSQMVDQVGGHAGEDMHGRMGAGMLEQQSNSKISDIYAAHMCAEKVFVTPVYIYECAYMYTYVRHP